MNIIWLPFKIVSSGGGLGGIIAFVLIIWGLGAGLGALIKLAANYWGMISFILGNAAILFAIIRSIINYKNNGVSFFGNIKAHGVVFSIIWLLGTLSLLFVGYSFRELILIDSSQTVIIRFLFGALFCVIGIIVGAIMGSQLWGEYGGDEVEFSAKIFAVSFVIIGISLPLLFSRSDSDAFGLGISLIVLPIIAGIAGTVIGAILGSILGLIGSFWGVGGILAGGLSGIICGGSLGVLLSIVFFEILKSSSNGILGAAGVGELVLAASFGLFNLCSPKDDNHLKDTLKGRIAFLVLLLLAALSIGIITNKYSKSGTAIKAAASATTVTKAATSVTATVTSDALNLRAKPSANSTILNTLRKGTRVSVTGEVRNGWLPVEYEGKRGFVNNKFVSIESK
jgi:hypothetical protein